MSTRPSPEKEQLWRRVSEDWWAVMVGFVLIALVYLQVLAKVPW